MGASLQGRPVTVWAGYEDWFSAFTELSTERQVGMGVGPIPHSAIVAYAERMGWGDDLDAFLACVREMDRTYLEWSAQDPKDRRTFAAEPMPMDVFASKFQGKRT